MRENPRPFEIFKHFKGNRYQVLTLAKDSETGEDFVVYQALYGEYTVYVRALSQFMSPVDVKKYPDAGQEYRFERISCREDKAHEKQPQKTMTEHFAESGEETSGPVSNEVSEADFLDPAVAEFLDAGKIEEKLNILAGVHHRITEDMLEIMAVASDIELNEGSVEEKYTELKNCLLMMEKYECKRMR